MDGRVVIRTSIFMYIGGTDIEGRQRRNFYSADGRLVDTVYSSCTWKLMRLSKLLCLAS